MSPQTTQRPTPGDRDSIINGKDETPAGSQKLLSRLPSEDPYGRVSG